jgi:hypothetical protein
MIERPEKTPPIRVYKDAAHHATLPFGSEEIEYKDNEVPLGTFERATGIISRNRIAVHGLVL